MNTHIAIIFLYTFLRYKVLRTISSNRISLTLFVPLISDYSILSSSTETMNVNLPIIGNTRHERKNRRCIVIVKVPRRVNYNRKLSDGGRFVCKIFDRNAKAGRFHRDIGKQTDQSERVPHKNSPLVASVYATSNEQPPRHVSSDTWN